MKKLLFIALAAMIMTGCDWAVDSLDVISGTKYVVTSKRKIGLHYLYRLVKEGDTWYDYDYEDTADFNVGDTLVLTISKR